MKLLIMGVDTKAIIRKGTTLDEIKNHLENKFGEVEIRSTSSEGYFTMTFKEPQQINMAASHRTLSVFYGEHVKSDYNIDGVLLSLGLWGSAVEIMKYLLDEFGGYLDENDCDDKDFCPVNIDAFYKHVEHPKKEELLNKVMLLVGYQKSKVIMELFEEYKSL